MPSVLEQLGMNPAGVSIEGNPLAGGATPPAEMPQQGVGAVPQTEAAQPAVMEGAKKLADTIVAGTIKGLEMAISIYGVGSEEGKALLKALNSLYKVIPEDKVDEILGGATAMPTGMPQAPQPPQMPTGQAGAGGANILTQLLGGK